MEYTRRDFGRIVVASCLVSAIGCKKKHHRRRNQPPSNQPPSIESIVRNFRNEQGEYDGRAYYTIFGKDPDGQVIKIGTKWNDESFKYQQGDLIMADNPIDKEMNMLKVLAIDNKKESSKLTADAFDVPKREEAYNHIKEMLDESLARREFQGYETNTSFFLDDQEVFVNFFITRNDGNYATVHYLPLEKKDDLEKELENFRKVTEFKIHREYFFMLPLDEVHKTMEDFVKKGYTSFSM